MDDGGKFKVLIVDDASTNLEILGDALSQSYEVYVALSGEDALASASANKPDLILLDVMMPGMDGFTLCSRIKNIPELASVPVIFVTALEEEADEMRGLALGAVDYITKPYIINLVKLRIRNQLELKSTRDALLLKTEELTEALSRIKSLEGMIPICMYCHKIRDEDRAWQKLEQYISDHSNASFSHGICPECFAKQLEELNELKRK